MPREAATIVLAAYYRRLWLRALELLDDAEQRADRAELELHKAGIPVRREP